MVSVRGFVWEQVADLVFDCFYVANLSKKTPLNGVLQGIKSCADFLAQSVRCVISWPRGVIDPEPRLQQINFFLVDLRRQLALANGLGALGQRAYEKLDRRTCVLQKLFRDPRVSGLFPSGKQGDGHAI